MSEPAAREKPDFIEKIADYAGWILAVSVAVIIAAWSLYFFQFRGSLSDDTAIWGQFGDFVGGTLNSVFAFFSFMILLSSLRLQLKELRLTREELEATRKELAASSIAQKMQADHFEREARKKDAIDAIDFMMRNGKIGSFYEMELTILNTNGNVHEEYIGGSANFPSKQDILKDGLKISQRSKSMMSSYEQRVLLFDRYCHTLWEISKRSPILIDPISTYEYSILELEKKGWITDLKFFGKHDFPLR